MGGGLDLDGGTGRLDRGVGNMAANLIHWRRRSTTSAVFGRVRYVGRGMRRLSRGF